MRIDKWLWAARFFRTRSLAARACDLGRIESAGHRVKPAREIRVGESLQIKTDGADFQVEVLELSDLRGPAPTARTLYRETESSIESRLKLTAQRKATPYFEPAPDTRPSKRDRRKINRLRNRA